MHTPDDYWTSRDTEAEQAAYWHERLKAAAALHDHTAKVYHRECDQMHAPEQPCVSEPQVAARVRVTLISDDV